MRSETKLILSGKTVFSIKDVQKLLDISDPSYTRLFLHRLKKSWVLLNPKKWIFTLYKYDPLELASKIITKSYISFETVLQKEAIIFQDYSHTITLASTNTITKVYNKITFQAHKLADHILYNPLGINNYENRYMIASSERAVCDMIYLYGNNHFDNIRPLQKHKLEKLKHIYNKRTALSIQQLIDDIGSK